MSAVARFVGGLVFLSSASGFDTYNADPHVTPDRHIQKVANGITYGYKVRDTAVNSAQGVTLLQLAKKNNGMGVIGNNDAKLQWLKTPGKGQSKCYKD